MTRKALEAFRDSGALRVSPQEVAAIHRALGAPADNFPLAGK